MDTTREVAKFNNRSVVEIKTENRITKYCTCSDYDESKDIGSRWNFGHYYDVYGNMTEEKALRAAMLDLYEVDDSSNVEEIKKDYNRMMEIADKVICEIVDHVNKEDLPTLFKDRVGLTKEEAKMFDIENFVYPKKYKIVEATLCREQKAVVKLVMPEDAYDDDAIDYIECGWDIEPDDEVEWDLDHANVYNGCLTKDEVKERYRDQLWNYDDIDNM